MVGVQSQIYVRIGLEKTVTANKQAAKAQREQMVKMSLSYGKDVFLFSESRRKGSKLKGRIDRRNQPFCGWFLKAN